MFKSLGWLVTLLLLQGCEPQTLNGPDSLLESEDDSSETDSSDSLDASTALCEDTFDIILAAPEKLSQTVLYSDISTKTTHPAIRAYTPEFSFWSDAAQKGRWIYLPECTPIDTSDMDNWSFPVGTRFFKEFVVDGMRVETRLIVRTGAGENDFVHVSYLWNEDETEAMLVPKEGLRSAKGTAHHIPSQSNCRRCHGSHEKKGGRPSRGLGFSAIQLSHEAAGLSLTELVDTERLTHAPLTEIGVPGDAVERAALGYLHINCGTCHNASRDGLPQTDMNLWLDVDQTSVESTSAYLTAVGKANKIFNDQHVTARIEPGAPDTSSILYRMKQRGNNAQMPPLASDQIDEAGVAAVKAWILSLP